MLERNGSYVIDFFMSGIGIGYGGLISLDPFNGIDSTGPGHLRPSVDSVDGVDSVDMLDMVDMVLCCMC